MAACRMLAVNGVKVVVNGRDEAAVRKTVQDLRADGGEATGRKLERHAAQRGHRGVSLDRAGDVDGNRRRHDSHVRARRRASRRAARTASRTASSASRARRSGTRRASGCASRHVRSPTTGTPSLSASAISESVP